MQQVFPMDSADCNVSTTLLFFDLWPNTRRVSSHIWDHTWKAVQNEQHMELNNVDYLYFRLFKLLLLSMIPYLHGPVPVKNGFFAL
jgi:hypothetical protein